MITRQFNVTHLFIMTGLQSHFIVNDFKIGCICSTNFAPFPHQLSKILCTLFSSTKLSVLRTIEKHCMGTIWLLGAKLWTDFQTITSRNDFLDRWYHWTTLSVQKIIVIMGRGSGSREEEQVQCWKSKLKLYNVQYIRKRPRISVPDRTESSPYHNMCLNQIWMRTKLTRE